MKAFLVTHVGDAAMLLGLAVLWKAAGTLSIAPLLAKAPSLPAGVATVAALLLFAGAVGKSAQFPLHFWLPDAMEGPTPVSALIHAATMVAAGVFLVARMWPLFAVSGAALTVILTIGVFTALAAATVAVAQTDIKKVLAYSTISQLGFMFAALGVGAWPAALFHLVTHAAFKALLFLGSGSVIHGTGTQELPEMGGLARRMPVTAVTWTVGALALAGFPGLAGFFSKDAVLAAVLHGSPVAGVALLVASFLTAFYITRATSLAFLGTARTDGHAHEGGPAMAVPLVVLAAGAAALGYFGGPLMHLLGAEAEHLDLLIAGVSGVVAVAGIGLGYAFYRRGLAADEALSTRLGAGWGAMRAAYGFDDAVARLVTRPVIGGADAAYERVDRGRIDAFVEWCGAAARRAGVWLAALENGDGQWYAALVGAGVILLLAMSVLAGRT
jgi:NADH-quinone oxidoreductase subunit L